MKRQFIILFILSSFFSTSCQSDEDTNNDCDPEQTTINLIENKRIKKSYAEEFDRNNYQVIAGDQLIVVYEHNGKQCDHIADDEFGEQLAFQIDKNMNNFKFTDEAIANTNCFYQQYGAWVDQTPLGIIKGTISGEKISDQKWKIKVNIQTPPLYENGTTKEIKFMKTLRF